MVPIGFVGRAWGTKGGVSIRFFDSLSFRLANFFLILSNISANIDKINPESIGLINFSSPGHFYDQVNIFHSREPAENSFRGFDKLPLQSIPSNHGESQVYQNPVVAELANHLDSSSGFFYNVSTGVKGYSNPQFSDKGKQPNSFDKRKEKKHHDGEKNSIKQKKIMDFYSRGFCNKGNKDE